VLGIEVNSTKLLEPAPTVAVAIDSKEPVIFCTLDARLPKMGIRLFYLSLVVLTVELEDI
jgi:hypothetical protein